MLFIQSFNSVSFHSVPGSIPTVILWQGITTYNYAGNKAECESKQDQLDEGDDTKPDSSENEKGHESRKTRKRKKIHVKQVTFIACLHACMNTE